MPFDYRKKGPFAVKMVLFLGTGFAIPFGAAYYQLYVNAALLATEMAELYPYITGIRGNNRLP